MASEPVKREFLVAYVHGMGDNFYMIVARSDAEIAARYPLFTVTPADSPDAWIPPQALENLRMYPGPGRPRDAAVRDRSPAERQRFLEEQERVWTTAAEALARYGLPGGSVAEVSQSQYWVDIDDDEDFRTAMHQYWRDDPRYRELPAARRLR